MDVISNLMGGFATSFTPYNLGMSVLGAFLGTMVGILPGLGPSATMAIILPITFGMEPIPAMIMLTSLYYGAMYGGSTTSILVNIPGEAVPSSPALTGTRWPGRVVQARLWVSRRGVHSSGER